MILRVSLLSLRMKKIDLKLKGLEWSQHFSYYKSLGFFQMLKHSLLRSPWFDLAESPNPFEILYVPSVPARMKKIQSKMKGLECSQDFIHYNPMLSVAMETSSSPIWSKTLCNLSPYPMMLQMKFDFNKSAGLRDINV